MEPVAAESWHRRVGALQNLKPLLLMLWHSHRGFVVAIIVLRALRAMIPLAVLWVGKLIVDGVVKAAAAHLDGRPVDWERLAALVLTELAFAVAGDALARGSTLVESLLADLFSNQLSVKLMKHAATLDLRTLREFGV